MAPPNNRNRRPPAPRAKKSQDDILELNTGDVMPLLEFIVSRDLRNRLLLLFGAVQLTMSAWGLWQGERIAGLAWPAAKG